MTVNAGAGGTDAQDWAEMVLRMMMRWAERRGFKAELLEVSAGEEAGIKSATFRASGENAYGLYSAEKGVHRLVRLSPFDAANRRQTSFAGVEVAPVVEDADVSIEDDDLQIDTYRASGAGGQHVNKTDSAVRITHRPTGVVVQCQNERSQSANKATAMAMLRSKLVERAERERQAEIARERGEAQDVNFGSQIRSYVLHPYTMVKDHRTDFEVGSAERVLDGDLDGFVRAWLEANAKASRTRRGDARRWTAGSGASRGRTGAPRSCSAASARAGRWSASRCIRAGVWLPAILDAPEADDRGVRIGAAFAGEAEHLRVDLPGGGRVQADLRDAVRWPRPWHGTGPAAWLPGFRQYWRPLVLRARAEGFVEAAGERWSLDGATAYVERNWGDGFPAVWWWGEAHDFGGDPVTVAFAGGPAIGPLNATAVVVHVGGRWSGSASRCSRACARTSRPAAGSCAAARSATASRSRPRATRRPRTSSTSRSRPSAARSRGRTSTSPAACTSASRATGGWCTRARARWPGSSRAGRRRRALSQGSTACWAPDAV